jgi:hypothetical protein
MKILVTYYDDEEKLRKFYGNYEYSVSCINNSEIKNWIKAKSKEKTDYNNNVHPAYYDIETSSDDQYDTFNILYEEVPVEHIRYFIKTVEEMIRKLN